MLEGKDNSLPVKSKKGQRVVKGERLKAKGWKTVCSYLLPFAFYL